MTIEETRAQIVSKLEKLRAVPIRNYSLHGKRQMMLRVQRQSDKLYRSQIEKQKVKLQSDLIKIDEYLNTISLKNEQLNGFDTPLVAPATSLWAPMPIRKLTRRESKKRLRRIR